MSAEARLCAACRHVAVVVSDRGSTFYRCERSKTDPRYAKYPRIPVLACPGFEPGRETAKAPPPWGGSAS